MLEWQMLWVFRSAGLSSCFMGLDQALLRQKYAVVNITLSGSRGWEYARFAVISESAAFTRCARQHRQDLFERAFVFCRFRLPSRLCMMMRLWQRSSSLLGMASRQLARCWEYLLLLQRLCARLLPSLWSGCKRLSQMRNQMNLTTALLMSRSPRSASCSKRVARVDNSHCLW